MGIIEHVSRSEFQRGVASVQLPSKPPVVVIDPVKAYCDLAIEALYDPGQDRVLVDRDTMVRIMRTAVDHGIYLVADKHDNC